MSPEVTNTVRTACRENRIFDVGIGEEEVVTRVCHHVELPASGGRTRDGDGGRRGLLEAPAPFCSTQVSDTLPENPAVNAIALVAPLVIPDVPPALVMLPPAIVQRYVIPVRAGTEAVRPVARGLTGLAVAMLGTIGCGATSMLAEPGALVVLPLLSTQVQARWDRAHRRSG